MPGLEQPEERENWLDEQLVHYCAQQNGDRAQKRDFSIGFRFYAIL
jgi:hypothetical protein